MKENNEHFTQRKLDGFGLVIELYNHNRIVFITNNILQSLEGHYVDYIVQTDDYKIKRDFVTLSSYDYRDNREFNRFSKV